MPGEDRDSVRPAHMYDAADRMGRAAAAITEEQEQVRAAVRSLGGSFSGEAADTYGAALARWQNSAEQIVHGLERMARTLRDSAESYQHDHGVAVSTASEAAQQITSMNAGLPGI